MVDRYDEIFSVRDILDSQLETSDHIEIGRVADIAVEVQNDGVITGPQALAGRVSLRLRALFRFMLRDRFEHRIPMSEIKEFGPTLYLRGKAEQYAVGQSERWIARNSLRWLPGSGR